MFFVRGQSFNGFKHLTEKVTSIIDACPGCGQPHNAHPTAKINKVKHLALIFRSVSLPHQDFIHCQKHMEQAFIRNFIHAHPFNETFIVNGKSQCCKGTSNDVPFTMLQAKNITRIQVIFVLLESAFSHQLFSLIFIQIGYFI